MSEQVPWLRPRTYKHFDFPRSLEGRSGQSIVDYVTNPRKIPQHSFYPFIRRMDVTKRFKKDKATGIRRIEKKKRPICYGAHLDSHIFSYYAFQLSQKVEDMLAAGGCQGNIFAYRSLGRSNADFAVQVFDAIERAAPVTVLCFDVTDFFGTLDHGLLKRAWERALGLARLPDDHFAVYKAITRYAEVEYYELCRVLGISGSDIRTGKLRRLCTASDFRDKVRASGLISRNRSGAGIVQGSPISAVLSNLYMLETDAFLTAAIAELGGQYFRYSDDLLVIVPSNSADSATALVREKLKEIKLEVNESKTETSVFEWKEGVLTSDRPLRYLGLRFDGSTILLCSKALSRYYRKMKSAVRRLYCRERKAPGRFRVPRRQLYNLYSHLGHRNFVSYARRAHMAAGEKSGISRQVRRHARKLEALIDKFERDTR